MLARWASDVSKKVPNTFQDVWSFIDGTVRPTCKPCPDPRKLPPGITAGQVQQAQYSGHKRRHAFKGHAIIVPSGMLIHWFGPVDGRRHDSFLLQKSGVLEQLPNLTIGGVDYKIYGDQAYPVLAHIVGPVPKRYAPPGSAARALNRAMSSVRIVSEWWYGIQTNTFQTLDFARWQRQYLTVPALQYAVCVLFVNCRTCMNGGNRISTYFNRPPPTLDEYLSGGFYS